jgi:hypothetical protein
LKTNIKIILGVAIFFIAKLSFCQSFSPANYSLIFKNNLNRVSKSDSAKQERTHSVSISGIFLSAGTGLSVPLAHFNSTSNPVFGIFGRLEFASTAIFPLIIGGEVDYYSYSGNDNYMTQNLLTSYQTKVLSYGISAEVTFARLIKSHYTIPYICIDVKSNKITRSISGISGSTLPNIPLKESRVSFGGGFGFTLFVLDFFVKYNYMKELSSFGVFTKIKFPVLRF